MMSATRSGPSPADRRLGSGSVPPVVGAFAVSYLGLWVHNIREFPGMSLAAPEMWAPLVVSIALAIGWLTTTSRLCRQLTLVWMLLNLIGGAILSVLPFVPLPFAPEQSLAHYVSHVVYGLAQLPLLVLAFPGSRSTR